MAEVHPEAQAIASQAAQLIVDEALDYESAKRKAMRQLGLERTRHMPTSEAVEDEVRTHLAIFHADTQRDELLSLRLLALRFMQRLESHGHAVVLHPYLTGAVWRGTATKRSRVLIECFADDPKMAEIALVNAGLRDNAPHHADEVTLSTDIMERTLNTMVSVDVTIRDADALRGALKPDARGQTWRGSTTQLQTLVSQAQATS